MVSEQRAYLKDQSSQAVKLSQQAVKAAQSQNFVEAQILMRQAAEAGRKCLAMLEESALEQNQ